MDVSIYITKIPLISSTVSASSTTTLVQKMEEIFSFKEKIKLSNTDFAYTTQLHQLIKANFRILNLVIPDYQHHISTTMLSAHCNAPDSSYGHVILAQYGAGSLSSSNSSQNSCQFGPGYTFRESNPFATINYTTVANNTAQYIVAVHYSTGVYFLTKGCKEFFRETVHASFLTFGRFLS